MGNKTPPYEIDVDGYTVRCADARALRDLLHDLSDGRRLTRTKRDIDPKRTLLEEGPHRIAIATLVANHPGGVFADELLAKWNGEWRRSFAPLFRDYAY